jgi:hypothetical protein
MRLKMKLFINLLVVVLAALTAAQAQSEITIALSDSVTIDGKIEESEWKDARTFDLSGGGKVFFKQDGKYLFVGVRGVNKGWSHLYLNQGENTDVTIMHASAALGMTLYKQSENKLWQPANPFAWDLRDRAMTAETSRKMVDHLAKNFWVANNNNLGNPTEIEFQVKPRSPSAPTIYLAIVYATDAKNPQFFPVTLKDDTVKEQLVYGSTPNDLKFDRSQWAKISLENKKTK